MVATATGFAAPTARTSSIGLPRSTTLYSQFEWIIAIRHGGVSASYHVAYGCWNGLVRLAMFSAIVWLVARVRERDRANEEMAAALREASFQSEGRWSPVSPTSA